MVDEKQIKLLLKKHFKIEGTDSIDPQSGVVNVTGTVWLNSKFKITQLPVKFGEVSRNFDCWGNKLKSLEGSPTWVGGYFNCSNNNLDSLQGAPSRVESAFSCTNNPNLANLQGAPTFVGDFFSCDFNRGLKSLQGAPHEVRGNFVCWLCPDLLNLQGAPAHVDGTFFIDWSKRLPLLRLLSYRRVVLNDAPDAVKEIMTRYAGQGRNSSLACGAELARKGFKENARW